MPDTSDALELKKVVAETQNDNLWEELDLQINNANQVFFEKLLKKYPYLTLNDLRLCAFLKMNLSTKEIANLTFRNLESIKVARSRLRKKLDLTHTNTNISTFLNAV